MQSHTGAVCVSTIPDWRNAFEDHLAAQGRSHATLRSYRSDLSHFIAWYESANATPFTPDLTTGVDLRQYRQHCLASGIKPATWNRRRACLAVFCAWLVDTRTLTYNPFQGVDAWQEQKLPPRWLEAPQLNRFLRQVELNVNQARTDASKRQAQRDAAIVSLMVFAGLREGEVVALNVGDITLRDRSGKVAVRLGKGGKWREIPLSLEARRAMGEWLAVRFGGSGAAGLDQPVGSTPLFDGKGAQRLTTRSVQRRIAEIGAQAKVKVTPHDLRHTFAKRLLDAGRPLTVVSQLLGHARLETTARYVTPSWGDLEKSVEGI